VHENDRDRLGRRQEGLNYRRRLSEDDVRIERCDLFDGGARALLAPGGPAVVDPKIVTLFPAKRPQNLFERRKGGDILGIFPTAMMIPSWRARSGCCAAAAIGKAAAPPSSAMNSRRCMARLGG